MTLQESILAAKMAGISLSVTDDKKILAKPLSSLTVEMRAVFQRQRKELISWLEDEHRILTWLEIIGERDPGIISDTITRCLLKPEDRIYFVNRCSEF